MSTRPSLPQSAPSLPHTASLSSLQYQLKSGEDGLLHDPHLRTPRLLPAHGLVYTTEQAFIPLVECCVFDSSGCNLLTNVSKSIFSSMAILQILDLSSNRIEEVEAGAFDSNSRLRTVTSGPVSKTCSPACLSSSGSTSSTTRTHPPCSRSPQAWGPPWPHTPPWPPVPAPQHAPGLRG